MINNKIKLILSVVLTICPIAESFAKGKVSTSFGVKAWSSTYGVTFNDGLSQSIYSDSGYSVGPTFNIRIKKFFGGINIYRGTYSYTSQNLVLDDITRTDMELYFGFDFVRNFSIIVGAKTLDSEWKGTLSDGSPLEFTLKYDGGFLAINGHSNVIGPGFVFYFTQSYTEMYYFSDDAAGNSNVEDSEFDLSGLSFEAGVALLAVKNHLIFSLSYKSQSYKSDRGTIDEIDGISGAFNFRF